MDIKYGRKRSGIRRELKAKIEDWLASINDEDVRKAARDDVIVTGGAIASMLLGEPINDFDMYFRTEDTTAKVAEYYCKQFVDNNPKVKDQTIAYTPSVERKTITNIKGESENRVVIKMKSAGVAGEGQDDYRYFEQRPEDEGIDFAESLVKSVSNDGPKYRPIFLSQNAITLSDKVQLVVRFFGEPALIHNNYDFVHATSYYDYYKNDLVLPAEALESLLSRTLIYRGSLYPIASIFRMKKFIERGWRITAGQQLKIMWQISEIDLTNQETFMEQLTGVDQAYMYQLIEALKTVDTDRIDSAYVSAIIDRIFD